MTTIMKKTIIIIAIACASLLAACNKNENPTPSVKAHEVTLTISTEELTKTVLSLDGSTYKRAWRSGDKISVIYWDSSNNPHNEKFTLTDGANTTTGTFACPSSEIPDTQYDIKIVYPYMDETYSSAWWAYSIDYQAYGQLDLSYIGNYDILYGYGNYSSGAFNVDSPLSCLVKYLHFPKGMQIIDGSSGALTVTLTLSASGSTKLYNQLLVAKNLNTVSNNEGDITVHYVYLTDGVLDDDIYLSLISETGTGASFNITVSDGTNSCTYSLDRGENYFYNGYIYHLKQSNFSPLKALE